MEKRGANDDQLPQRDDKDRLIISILLAERVIAHNHVSNSHTSLQQELDSLNHNYTFPEMDANRLRDVVRSLRGYCMHCDHFPRLFPTPYNLTDLAAKRPGDNLRSDYLGYINAITDDFSRKTQLMYFETCNATNTVKALMRWRASYGLND